MRLASDNWSQEPSNKDSSRNKIAEDKEEDQTRNIFTLFRFVADRSARNAIFTLTTLMDKSTEVKTDLHLCFIKPR